MIPGAELWQARPRCLPRAISGWPCPFCLAELAGHFYFAGRAPRLSDWQAQKTTLAGLKRHGELVVVAPHWADPLARLAFGRGLLPMRDEARPDDTAYRRAIEVGILGQHAPELSGWRTVEEKHVGRFLYRVLDNPAPAKVLYDFVDHVDPGHADAYQQQGTTRRTCPWNAHARRSDGGLAGHVAFPSRRFECGRRDSMFVGVTIIDDQDYRPRRCIWAHPPAGGPTVVVFRNVPVGRTVHGYGGLSWLLTRDGAGTPIELTVKIDGQSIGRVVHRDQQGWKGFDLPAGAHAGHTADVQFEVRSDNPDQRDFCFYADTR